MKRRTFVKGAAALPAVAALGLRDAEAQEPQPIMLPRPETEGGLPVLAAWFHNVDRTNTPKEFKPRPEQKVLFGQTVGYPAKS